MSHWIFKANPEKYRLQARLRDPNPAIIELRKSNGTLNFFQNAREIRLPRESLCFILFTKLSSWRVSRYRYEIRPGDTAFVWQTGKERGLCATLRIDSVPREIDELSLPRNPLLC